MWRTSRATADDPVAHHRTFVARLVEAHTQRVEGYRVVGEEHSKFRRSSMSASLDATVDNTLRFPCPSGGTRY